MPKEKLISKILLKILIVCFHWNVGVILVILPLINYMIIRQIDRNVVHLIHTCMVIPVLFLWSYCIYFYYKFDRYSSAGIKLFFLNGLYSAFYFYKVIWKRKRDLINSCEKEPVLGNKIFIEIKDDD